MNVNSTLTAAISIVSVYNQPHTSVVSTFYRSVTDLEILIRATARRKKQVFRPGTSNNHKRQITLYVAFYLYVLWFKGH